MEELSARGTQSLRDFFTDLVWRHFFEDIGLDEPQVAHYVSCLLADFSVVENLRRIKGCAGQPLLRVAEMLVASNPLLESDSFDHERRVRKHVGDFTLFMSGLFPESITGIAKRSDASLDSFIDFVQAGKESYAIVSCFNQWEYRDEAPLFRRLSDNFELCVAGLNFVKHDLEELQRDGRHAAEPILSSAAEDEP